MLSDVSAEACSGIRHLLLAGGCGFEVLIVEVRGLKSQISLVALETSGWAKNGAYH